MSLAVNVLMKLSVTAGRILADRDFDVEIIDVISNFLVNAALQSGQPLDGFCSYPGILPDIHCIYLNRIRVRLSIVQTPDRTYSPTLLSLRS